MKKQAFCLLCGALVVLSSGCSASPESQPMDPTVLVETAEVHTDTLTSNSTYIGTISAEGTANVVTMVSGTVEKVEVSVGEKVSVGDLLCRFDDENAQINLRNAQTNYQSASANYGGTDFSLLTEQVRMAQENYDASQELYDSGAISRVELDQALQSLNSAQATLEAAQASLNSAKVGIESAQYQLSLYHLTAPISGVVEAVNVLENNFASSGTVAFVISNAQNKTVTFYVTDEVCQNLTMGQQVTVTARKSTYGGTISEISGVVDASTGLFQIKALVNGGENLPDGLSVSVTTVSSVAHNAMIVPSDALYFENGAAYVYLAQNGKAIRTEVEVALYTQESAAVTAGLKDGDVVITSWSATLKNETPIQLSQPEEQNTEQQADEVTEEAE